MLDSDGLSGIDNTKPLFVKKEKYALLVTLRLHRSMSKGVAKLYTLRYYLRPIQVSFIENHLSVSLTNWFSWIGRSIIFIRMVMQYSTYVSDAI